MKRFKIVFALALMSILLVGCTTSKAYTWKVETGDNIKVSIKTNDGYDITSNNPFEVSKDGKIISYGIFVANDTYEQYKTLVTNNTDTKIIDQGNKNGVEYIFYEYQNSINEYNYILKVNDSNTGILLANNLSKEEAEKIFHRLTISKE